MPLVGTICCQDGETKPFDHCMTECRKGNCQHTVPLLAAMAGNAEKRKDIGISSSVLGGCPRQFILAERNDYYEDPARYYNRWIGSFGHYAIEMGCPYPGIIQEVRYYRDIEVDGVTHSVSGQPDWYDEVSKLLADSKFVNWPPGRLYESHESQVNVYRWLLEGNGLDVDKAEIHYYHPPRRDSKERFTRFDVPIWTDAAVEGYLREKLRPFAGYARDNNIVRLKAPEGYPFGDSCPFRHPANPGRCCCQPTPCEPK